METVDEHYDNYRNYKTQEIPQTYIVFYKKYNDNTYKFVSRTTKLHADAVKRHTDSQKGIDLYIDPKNRRFIILSCPLSDIEQQAT
jgi:hypothetical protein